MAAKIQDDVKKGAEKLAEKFMTFEVSSRASGPINLEGLINGSIFLLQEELSGYLGEHIKSEIEDTRQRKAEGRRLAASAMELLRKVSTLTRSHTPSYAHPQICSSMAMTIIIAIHFRCPTLWTIQVPVTSSHSSKLNGNMIVT